MFGKRPENVQEISGKFPGYGEFFIFSLLIRGAINAVWGDVLGGSGGGFWGCFGRFGGGFLR